MLQEPYVKAKNPVLPIAETRKHAPANTRASRRGNTGGASVIPLNWAYRVSRQLFKYGHK